MSIKYEIQSIKNSQGSGEERSFARIYEGSPMTSDEIENYIQANCSLTKSDVRAALSALRELMADKLAEGARFRIPGIGGFSFAAGLELPDGVTADKVRGNHIRVRGINFRPDIALFRDATRDVHFERADFTTKSREYSEDSLLLAIRTYLAGHDVITRRVMELHFGLRRSAAQRWLRHFSEVGVLKRVGLKSSPVYMLDA